MAYNSALVQKESMMSHTKTWMHDKKRREKWIAFVESLNPEIDAKAVRLMDELGFVGRALYHVGEESVEATGLSFAQYRVLMHLFYAEQMGHRQELNPSQISERQGVSRNTMSSFIRNLEDEGLIARTLDPEDRRRFNIRLTDAGRQLVSNHARQHLETISHYFDVLSADEQTQLTHLLTKVSAHLTAVRTKSSA